MNILLWVLQIMLALWNVTGGLFTMSNYDQLKGGLGSDLPSAVWVAISLLQVLFAIGLVLPGVLKMVPQSMIPISAVYLAANALLGCAIFSKYAGFPGMLWGVLPAILALFVAYGRKA